MLFVHLLPIIRAAPHLPIIGDIGGDLLRHQICQTVSDRRQKEDLTTTHKPCSADAQEAAVQTKKHRQRAAS